MTEPCTWVSTLLEIMTAHNSQAVARDDIGKKATLSTFISVPLTILQRRSEGKTSRRTRNIPSTFLHSALSCSLRPNGRVSINIASRTARGMTLFNLTAWLALRPIRLQRYRHRHKNATWYHNYIPLIWGFSPLALILCVCDPSKFQPVR